MIENTISEIEAKIRRAESANDPRKEELLQLLATLKFEVAALSKTHGEQAQSIAGFARVSAHEATRTAPNAQSLDLSLRGLRSSVGEFEASHPKLVRAVNSFCQTLANWGI